MLKGKCDLREKDRRSIQIMEEGIITGDSEGMH
jgi:hypothetical protein